MCGLGTTELLVVFAIVLLVFGASRLPKLGQALGETVRSFRRGQGGRDQDGSDEGPKSMQINAEVTRLPEGQRRGAASDIEEAEVLSPKSDEN